MNRTMEREINTNTIDYGQQIKEAIHNTLKEDTRSDAIGGKLLDRKKFKDEIQRLSKVNPYRSMVAIFTQWVIIITAAALAIWSAHWAVYVLAMIIIATRQHAFGILMHDACHFRLFPNKKVNDMLTDLLVSFHLGASTSLYRKWHYPHHRYTNTDRDPEVMGEKSDPDTWRWPNSKRHMVKVFLKDIFGLNILKMAGIMTIWSPWPRIFLPSNTPSGIPKREKIALVLFTIAGIAALIYFNLWLEYLILWVLTSLTFFNVIFKFRSFSEHKAVGNQHELNSTRTTLPNWLERFFIAPLNVNYHLEHHLFPSVPFYNLPQLHRLLMKESVFRREGEIAHTYLGPHRNSVVNELTVKS